MKCCSWVLTPTVGTIKLLVALLDCRQPAEPRVLVLAALSLLLQQGAADEQPALLPTVAALCPRVGGALKAPELGDETRGLKPNALPVQVNAIMAGLGDSGVGPGWQG